MDIKTASQLIEENLHNIYAFSYSKVFDKDNAEDLSQDIILAALKSVNRLENDTAFWKYFWRIAENVLCAYIRKNRKETVEFNDKFIGIYWNTPEDEIIKSEEIKLLRRELSLLSKMYRDVTVKHYIYGKSCKEISQELGISVEMTKFYLHKSRKILKEGVSMTREYGEKSYNPQIFRMNFWGDSSDGYRELFERKLPGNILLSAYEKPLSITELSLELGISTAYLEDEIEILERNELIKRIGDKYQTNIIILRDTFEKKVIEFAKPLCKTYSKKIINTFEKIIPKLKELNFYGDKFDENSFKWCMLNIGLYQGLRKHDKICTDKYGQYPQLVNGSFGFVFGHDNDYENIHWHGFYGGYDNTDKTMRVTIQNYKIIAKAQRWECGKSWQNAMLAMCDAALFKKADESNNELVNMIEQGFIKSDNGSLSPNFPVFSSEAFGKAIEILSPISEITNSCMIEACEVVSKMLYKDVPASMKKYNPLFAHIWYPLESMALIVEAMVETGYLFVPEEKTNLCMFGVHI